MTLAYTGSAAALQVRYCQPASEPQADGVTELEQIDNVDGSLSILSHQLLSCLISCRMGSQMRDGGRLSKA